MPNLLKLSLAVLALAATSTFAAEPSLLRKPWTTSRLTGSPTPPAPYTSERVFAPLSFDRPEEIVAIPGSDRLAVLEVKGQIYTFENRPDAASLERDLFADLKPLHPQFNQVYGLAFHPQFAKNRTCYVCYVLKANIADGSRVSRFRVTDTNPPKLDLASEEIVLTWVSGGHNGGHLQFGADGYLYITTGDGGSSFPPDGLNTGQDVSDLLGSILRIDVDRADADRKYRIPADNPFVDLPNARGEVWAFGLRNPWKICFDPADGSLWTGDVGWEMWEMIYRVQRGGNYGWSLVEGRQPVHAERQRGPTPILPPTVEHDHTESRSITGGYFYQGSRLPELRGAYIYGDYVTGKVWGLRHEQDRITWRQELVDTPLQIVSFGLDQQGEVYLLDFAGTLHRLAPNPRRTANRDFPRKLSETGLFASVADQLPAPGVIPYSIHAEPWADGTTAERFVALPGDSRLGTYKKTDVQIGYIAGDWQFPTDGVLAKTVSIELEPGRPQSRRRLETQVLHFDVDTWRGYNYIWNDEQSDAVLAEDGTDRLLEILDPNAPNGRRRQTWHHASRLECLLCHTTRSGSIQGFRVPQLSGAGTKSTDSSDQLASLDQLALFSEPLPKDRNAWPNPHDTSAALDQRARAYLHVNCAHCHRRGGGGSAPFDVQYSLATEKTALLGTRPTQGSFNMHNAEIVAPGDPYRSVLYYRLAKLGPGHMPQLGSQRVDDAGLKLIHDWIASLKPATSTPAEQVDLAQADRYLSTPSQALRLITALDGQPVEDALRRSIVERGTAHADPLVRDLFERYLPEERRAKRLGNVIRPQDILKIAGDAARGRELFFTTATVQCRNCHRVGDFGRQLGPDLTQIGKKLDRERLLENLLEPSKTIEPAFVTYLAETADGRVLSGLLVKRTDAEIVLRDTEAKEVRIPAADVERFVPQQKSLMPELLLRDFTAQQAADLLAFLSGLR